MSSESGVTLAQKASIRNRKFYCFLDTDPGACLGPVSNPIGWKVRLRLGLALDNGPVMKIFVSYSFRDETKWVVDYVIPLINCFGHQAITGRILEGQPIH
jgi:hypothetical protein